MLRNFIPLEVMSSLGWKSEGTLSVLKHLTESVDEDEDINDSKDDSSEGVLQLSTLNSDGEDENESEESEEMTDAPALTTAGGPAFFHLWI